MLAHNKKTITNKVRKVFVLRKIIIQIFSDIPNIEIYTLCLIQKSKLAMAGEFITLAQYSRSYNVSNSFVDNFYSFLHLRISIWKMCWLVTRKQSQTRLKNCSFCWKIMKKNYENYEKKMLKNENNYPNYLRHPKYWNIQSVSFKSQNQCWKCLIINCLVLFARTLLLF